MFPIDAVIPWVDGNDPALNAKRAKYVDLSQVANEDVAGATRYKSIGEIYYCVASILKFAPWINRIYIITDGQDPKIKSEKVSIVDHSTIFKGHEDKLPIFNSNAIETFIWNIPELSEHFIYFNDDFFLVKDVQPEDFFRDGKVVCFGDWYSTALYRFQRFVKPKKHGQAHVGFKDFMVNGLNLAGGGCRFIYLAHAPRPLLRSWFKEFTESHPEAVETNLKTKFRDPSHWQTQEPFYIDMYRSGKCIITPQKKYGLYYKPHKNKDYTAKKLKSYDAAKDAFYLCANSLDCARPEDLKAFLGWLESRLGPVERP